MNQNEKVSKRMAKIEIWHGVAPIHFLCKSKFSEDGDAQKANTL